MFTLAKNSTMAAARKGSCSHEVSTQETKLVVISQEIVGNSKIRGKSWFLGIISQGVLKQISPE